MFAIMLRLAWCYILLMFSSLTNPVEMTESCINNPRWGPCLEGNTGFRHPEHDTVIAQQLNENGARIVIDGHLNDWVEHDTDKRYSDVEFATLDGTVVSFEEPFSNNTHSGPEDHSHSFMLKWDSSWLYFALTVKDENFEAVTETNSCYDQGLQLAIEVGGYDSVDLNGRSAVGLIQAQRAHDTNVSRMVLINIGPAQGSGYCHCDGCPDVNFAPASSACCVHYESHGVSSPHGAKFEQRVKAAIRRQDQAQQTIHEIAIHRDDIMYPDWEGRVTRANSRWTAGTRFGFSFAINEGEEKFGGSAPKQHSWGGYYPHVCFWFVSFFFPGYFSQA
mmetsp:Transcript_26808/g.63590  ORF Transcript_26808/g.63590 Transcript_26808/m.63590 type:complete len:333 (+) Transcript_26808:61-1059(+)